MLNVAAGLGSPVKRLETHLGDIALYKSSHFYFFLNFRTEPGGERVKKRERPVGAALIMKLY